MNTYYVYVLKNDANENVAHIFVLDPIVFATTQFNPRTMEFTNSVVEAENEIEAQSIFTQPTLGTVMWADEPHATKRHREIFEEKVGQIQQNKQHFDAISDKERQANLMWDLSNEMAQCLHTASVIVSNIARAVRNSTNDNPEFTSEDIYERLLANYAAQLARMGYKP